MIYKIKNGAVTLGNKTILEEINFEVKNQEHVAIVGRNGCGKTTLLRAIIGNILLEKGLAEDEFLVTKFGDFDIGYIKQDAIMDEDITMLDEILKSYKNLKDVEKKLKKLEYLLETDYHEKLLNQYQDLQQYFKTIGGYTYKKEYELALLKFGFQDSDKYKKIKEFSYGQRTKIAFLRLVLSKPDLLLLDEPTNHLDISAIEWLEDYLKNYSKMLVVVSHDRMFLDRVCNVTYEIEYGSLKRYAGNYSFYEKQKKADYIKNLSNYERQEKEVERLRKIADRFRYKPSKASMALSKLKQIERMIKIDEPLKSDTKSFSGNFNPLEESYREVLKVKNLEFGYDKVLGMANFLLERGERLGIIGENGSGKSTFIKTIIGDIPKISGKFVFGTRVTIGYFDQNVESLNLEDTVLDVMINEFPMIEVEELRTSLGTFGFTGEMVFQKVSSLSGGQKVKLLLCKIMKKRPNLLILDEPTNHLDIISREAIEDLLLEYKGTVIFISHDRYFIKKLATSLLVFENGEVNYYKDTYDNYLEKNNTSKKSVVEIEKTVIKDNKKEKYVSEFKEKSKLERKVKRLEEEIEKLEIEIKKCHDELMLEAVYLDLNKSREVEEKRLLIEKELNNKMEEWEQIILNIDKMSN